MNCVTKQSMSEQLSALQSSTQVTHCFEGLSQLISLHCETKLTQPNEMPFSKWWHACCELLAPRQICVAKIDCNKLGDAGVTDQTIELFNDGPLMLDLGGWCITAGIDGRAMVFPRGTIMLPKGRLLIYSCRKGAFSFNSATPIWNTKGDTALLYDQNRHLVCSFAYGRDCHSALEISAVHFDVCEQDTTAEPYGEVRNNGGCWIDLTGWHLRLGNGADLVFADGTLLKPFGRLKVFSNQHDRHLVGSSFDCQSSIWRSSGNIAWLNDPSGEMVCQYRHCNKN